MVTFLPNEYFNNILTTGHLLVIKFLHCGYNTFTQVKDLPPLIMAGFTRKG